MSKERPFTPRAQEFERILAGRQTQFRRPIKPQPPTAIYHDGHGLWYPTGPWSGQDWRCPFGVSGDILRVQEIHWIDWYPYGVRDADDNPGVVHHRANHPYPAIAQDIDQKGLWECAGDMPAWASRLTLRVLKVGVERVQDIDEIGAQKEGWFYQGHNLHHAYDPVTMDTARRWFIEQWDAAYAAQGFGFDASPWIWKVDFELVPLGYKGNDD